MSEPQQDDVRRTIEEAARWIRVMATPAYGAAVNRTISTDKERAAFELANGERNGKSLATASNASEASVSGWAKKWRAAGIAYENAKGNIQHLAPPPPPDKSGA